MSAVLFLATLVLVVVASRESRRARDVRGDDDSLGSWVFWMPLAAIIEQYREGETRNRCSDLRFGTIRYNPLWFGWSLSSPAVWIIAYLVIPWATFGYLAWRWRRAA